MIRDYSQLSWEDEISLNQTLHFSYAKLYFHEKNQEFNKDKYFPIGVKNSDYLFTNIALLLSDENPFIIKMACYGNVLNFKYKKEFSGSIIKIATDVLNEAEMFNITSSVIPKAGGIRQETKSYPGKSLREAILNALCHADYSMPSNIKIEFYVDRVEITNPGGIYRYNIDDILLGIQSFRNPKLISVLHRLGFVENYGTGIKRIHEAYPNYDVQSFLIDKRLWFRVILPDLNYKKELLKGNVPNVPNDVPNSDEEIIIEAIKQSPNITRERLANLLGKSEKTVTRIINSSKKIIRVGSKKIIEENKEDSN